MNPMTTANRPNNSACFSPIWLDTQPTTCLNTRHMVEQAKHMADETQSRFTRFDITVGIIALLLAFVIGLLVFFGSPQQRLGASVAYLAPAQGGQQDVYMASMHDPGNPTRLTEAEHGVYDFGVSPDGRYLAYAERRATERGGFLTEIMLLDMQTGQTRQLTNCLEEDADCRAPVFREGNDLIAYERMAINSALSQVGPGQLRIWVLDLRTGETRPLADDSQFVGYSPRWSDDGSTLIFYSSDVTAPGIMVLESAQADGARPLKYVPSNHGTIGTLSPDGQYLVYPEVTQQRQTIDDETTQRIVTYLKIADLDTLEYNDLTDPNAPIDDTNAAWHPDGQRLVIERRYTDERYTRGYQIYWYDRATGNVDPLIYDPDYSHGFFEWNATGDKLVAQRFRIASIGSENVDSRPSIWVKDIETGELHLIAENAFFPRWVLP